MFFYILALIMASSVTAIAAGSDELWEVTTRMEMRGMHFEMPAMTQKFCIKKVQKMAPNNAVPKNKDQDCKISGVMNTGNKSS